MTDLLTDHQPAPGPSPEPSPERRLTRRALLGASLGGAAALAAAGYGIDRLIGGGGGVRHAVLPANGVAQHFHSRPDLLPTFTHYYGTDAQAPGMIMISSGAAHEVRNGPMIIDPRGDLAWFRPLPAHHWLTNFQVHSWRGRPVLSWWEGRLVGGYGVGEAVIADSSYREIARVRAAGGHTMDLHELQLTPEGTALFTCTPRTVIRDVSALGGPSRAQVLDSIFQEVEVSSGRLLRQWSGLDHIAIEESYRTQFAPFDYLHINSLDVLPDGNLLMSARNTWALYKLDRRTGAIIWRLGGKRSDFQMGPRSQFAWQHDARMEPGGRVTVFDDGFDGVTRTHKYSRGLILDLDESARTVAVATADVSPTRLLSSAMGSAQLLPNGNLLVGFGNDPYTTEFSPAGDVVANLRMPWGQHSYRAYRQPWAGHPSGAPAVAAVRSVGSGAATLYASFNGATEVVAWRLEGGTRRSDLAAIGRPIARTGFETGLPIGTGDGFARAVALDAAGRPLGTSQTVRV